MVRLLRGRMTDRIVVRPSGHESSEFITSMSGGKDSLATALALREADIPCRYVFADTGWEAPETYEYLGTIERHLGITIDRVGWPGGFAERAVKEALFPHGKAGWCTRELKVKPLRRYHRRVAKELDTDTVSVVGIRADESPKRALIEREFEYDEGWGGYVWRPILAWAVADVLAIHHRHGVPVNPLYLAGHSRVGCFPCRNADKATLELWSRTHPEMADRVRDLEARVTEARHAKGHSGIATMFADGAAPMPIDEVLAWSRTSRGGVQLKLLQQDPDSGCFRWGLCEPPSSADDEP